MDLLTNKPTPQTRTMLCLGSAALLCAMLSGCNVGPKYVPPAMTAPQAYKESPAQFKEAGDWTVAQPQDATLRGNWWEIYNEPDLNALEKQLNVDNQNIRQAFENFMEARALVREARSQYFPTVSVGPSYSRSQSFLKREFFRIQQRGDVWQPSVTGLRASRRRLLGARLLGQGPQHRARRPIHGPGQRRRP